MIRVFGIIKLYRKQTSALLIAGGMLFAAFFSASADAANTPARGELDAPALGTSDTSDGSNITEDVKSSLIKNSFSGNLTLYRWEKVTGAFPKPDKFTPVMIYANDSYIAGTRIDNAYPGEGIMDLMTDGTNGYRGMKSSELAKFLGLKHTFDDLVAARGQSWFNDKIYKKYKTGHYVSGRNDTESYFVITDRAYNFSKKDPQIKTDRDVFYTDDDRDCPYIYYVEQEYNRYGEMLNAGDNYIFRFSGDTDYILGLTMTSSGRDERFGGVLMWPYIGGHTITELEGSIYINRANDNYEFHGMGGSRNAGKDVFFNQVDDVFFAAHGTSTKYKAYMAEELHFSSLNGDVKIGEGQILNVGETDYLSGDGADAITGAGEHTKGCFIPRGSTVTVNAGGVLSISGNLLNNGTIINNGGTILIQKGGSISSFLAGSDIGKYGCGTLKCNSGDIIIERGGALYAGMNDEKGNVLPFYLDGNSTLINCGLLCYGRMRVSSGSRVELRSGSTTIGRCWGGSKVYEKSTGSSNDKYEIGNLQMGWDMLPYYTDNIIKNGTVGSSEKSLFLAGSFSGIYTEGSGSPVILRYKNAKVDDPKAKSLMTEKSEL